MTLSSSDIRMFDEEAQCLPERGAACSPREKAGYGACIVCGCGGYLDSGTGDCTCGHSFGQHYS
jgi:hypothetical protein